MSNFHLQEIEALNKIIYEQSEQIKILEKAGDLLCHSQWGPHTVWDQMVTNWFKAKDAKLRGISGKSKELQQAKETKP